MADPTDDTSVYLIWSHEHRGWWGPDGCGYVGRLSQAGRYSHDDALFICANAIPGTAEEIGALPELPVRLEDVDAMLARYWASFPHVEERWR